MLEKLPRDVFWLILDRIPAQRDLMHLCSVSKTLYDLTLPKLYEKVVIGSKSEKRLDVIDTEPFLRGNPTSRLCYVKHVQISAPFHENIGGRCIHLRDLDDQMNRDFGEDLGEKEAGGRRKFQQLAVNVVRLLEKLKDESLKSFSWELGTCIPKQVLGSMGYLPSKQTSLEAISLITGSGCPYEDDITNAVDLSRFNSLKRISWIGLQSNFYFQALRYALGKNLQHLTHLRLEYGSQSNEIRLENEDDSDTDNEHRADKEPHFRSFFGPEALEVDGSTVTPDVIFPALTSLSLGFIPLRNAYNGLIYMLNVGELLHLTLYHCPGMENFLGAISESSRALKLLSLEYTCGSDEDESLFMSGAFEGPLEIAPHLTDLFLSIPGPITTLEMWHTIANNKLPLTRFVYHQRFIEIDDTSSRFEEEEEDLDDLSLLLDDMEELERAGEEHPFAQFNLLCLGLSIDPSFLKSILTFPGATKSLKLLHIRKSGSDMAGSMETRESMFELEGEDIKREVYQNKGLESDSDAQKSEDSLNNISGNIFRRISAPSTTASSNRDTLIDEDSKALFELAKLPQNLLPFARWAFGAEGIPSLQVLAYGDFSFEGRFGPYNHILCRQAWTFPRSSIPGMEEEDITWPFRPLRENDVQMMELVSENMDFLTACPLDTIVMRTED